MKTAPAFLVGTHRYSFRAGQRAVITGVVVVDFLARPCFVVCFPDGVQDLIAIEDYKHYRIGGEDVSLEITE